MKRVQPLLYNDRQVGEKTTVLCNPFPGYISVYTFPPQRILTQQQKNCVFCVIRIEKL
jgi:hypothetical protein